MFAPADFLDLEHTAHPKLFENQNYVWDALKQIASYLQFRLKPAVFAELIGKPFISNRVFVGRGTVVEQGAVLKGPAWIGENCQIRSGCYVRENVIAGNGVVMGNSWRMCRRRTRRSALRLTSRFARKDSQPPWKRNPSTENQHHDDPRRFAIH